VQQSARTHLCAAVGDTHRCARHATWPCQTMQGRVKTLSTSMDMQQHIVLYVASGLCMMPISERHTQ
jgi:hypothetical protein